jgi:hypothetical protein
MLCLGKQPGEQRHQYRGGRHGNVPGACRREYDRWSAERSGLRAGSRRCELAAIHLVRLRCRASGLWESIWTEFERLLVHRWPCSRHGWVRESLEVCRLLGSLSGYKGGRRANIPIAIKIKSGDNWRARTAPLAVDPRSSR